MFTRFANKQNQPKPAPAAPAPAATAAATAAAVTASPKPVERVSTSPVEPSSSPYFDLKLNLHQQLLGLINLSMLDKLKPEDIRREVGEIVRDLLVRDKVPLSQNEHNRLVTDLLDEVLGLGPIEPLLKDPTITDIMINGPQTVFIERRGKIELSPVKFKDERHLQRILNKIVSTVGRRVDESQPLVDARLLDGSRVNAVIPPVAVDGTLISIRKFSKTPYDIQKLIDYGALTPEMAEFLAGVVASELSVLVSGGTGSGKTTMLNALSRFIDNTERIVTIEDAAELQLQQIHVARMETRPANIEGKGEITQRDLVKNSLRMRPDRIILGECRGGEAFDMLQAMNTGHEGSLTTVHANTPRDAVSRLEQMVGMAGFDIPLRGIRQQIASAIRVVVQMQRLTDGKRRMVSVQEITGMESDVVSMQEIFKFHRIGVDPDGNVLGEYRATGIRPKVMQHLEVHGVKISSEIFKPDRVLG
jgi:pilus assembly protein CpaF